MKHWGSIQIRVSIILGEVQIYKHSKIHSKIRKKPARVAQLVISEIIEGKN